MNKLIEISASEVEKLIDEDVLLLDIRREDEWEYTGVIENAHKMTFFDMYGNADVATWMQKFESLVTSKDQQFVLICAHANRTRVIGNYLIENHQYTNVCHLTGGMAAWLEKNKATIK